jgi:hypothetical protein
MTVKVIVIPGMAPPIKPARIPVDIARKILGSRIEVVD